MNRRRFLGTLLGAGAGTLVAPSMVWPFRKIFLPTVIPATQIHFLDLDLRYWRDTYVLRPSLKEIAEIHFDKEQRFYELMKSKHVAISSGPFRIPIRINRETQP